MICYTRLTSATNLVNKIWFRVWFHPVSVIVFFLEHAGELRIFVLRRRNSSITRKQNHLDQNWIGKTKLTPQTKLTSKCDFDWKNYKIIRTVHYIQILPCRSSTSKQYRQVHWKVALPAPYLTAQQSLPFHLLCASSTNPASALFGLSRILENTTLTINYESYIKLIYKINSRTPALGTLTNLMSPLTA